MSGTRRVVLVSVVTKLCLLSRTSCTESIGGANESQSNLILTVIIVVIAGCH